MANPKTATAEKMAEEIAKFEALQKAKAEIRNKIEQEMFAGGFGPSLRPLDQGPSPGQVRDLPKYFPFALSPWPPRPKPPSIDVEKLDKLKSAEPYKVTARIPDLVEVITAWRAWRFVYSDGLKLQALGTQYIWQPKKAIEAFCDKSAGAFGSGENHRAPDFHCSCGVWAFKELDTLVAAVGNKYNTVSVLGKVSLWGRVIETENGWRAEKAYPSELYLLDNKLEDLSRIYDVPVRTL